MTPTNQSPLLVQWIKASERLPAELGKVHWRESENKLPITSGFAYKYAISEDSSDLVEWLDESASQLPKDSAKQGEVNIKVPQGDPYSDNNK